MRRAKLDARKAFAAQVAERDALRAKRKPGRKVSRPSSHRVPGPLVDGSRYRNWWLNRYGDEALEIAQAFVADLPNGILPSRPAGSSLSGYQPSESPVGRPPSRLEFVSAGNRHREERSG